jgi:TNFR/NGFR cysteine-rich region
MGAARVWVCGACLASVMGCGGSGASIAHDGGSVDMARSQPDLSQGQPDLAGAQPDLAGGGCASGTWDNDANPATACVAWTACVTGQHIDQAGSATSDQTCAACAAGSFSTTSNAASCAPWTDCTSGQHIVTAGSATSDRTCAACDAGTYSSSSNQSTCVADGACAAGTVQTSAATSSAPPVCAACDAGTYCAGGTASPVPCVSGTWDHDADPATACVAWTDCIAGQHVNVAGSATTDRACAACGGGTFSATNNAASCASWTVCTAGQHVVNSGSATSNRTCAACAAGSYSSASNQATCTACSDGTYCAGGGASPAPCVSGTWDDDASPTTPCVDWTDCVAGHHIDEGGTATTDQTCAACDDGTFSDADNAAICTLWSDCPAGDYIATPGSATGDRLCAPCDAGTYSSSPDQSTCSPDGACAAGTQQTAPPTPSSPPSCAACSAGTYCAGGTASPAPCVSGTWDGDANPATACVAWTACVEGTHIDVPGSATTDQTCAACAGGTFSSTNNAASCTAFSNTTCTAGQYVLAGTSTADRSCPACGDGTFSTTSNASSCTAWTACTGANLEVLQGTTTLDRVCSTWNQFLGAGVLGNGAVAAGSGSVLVAGTAQVPQSDGTNLSGMMVWAASSNGNDTWWNPGLLNTQLLAIAADASGNVFVTGYIWGITENMFEAFSLLSQLNDGFDLYDWSDFYPPNPDGNLTAVSVTPDGNFVIAGWIGGALPGQTYSGGQQDAFLRVYQPDPGAEVWTREFGGAGGANGFAQANALGVDASGNIFVAGKISNAIEETRALVRKYDPDGNVLWTGTFVVGELLSLSFDASGNILVAGDTGDYALVEKIDPDGNELWNRQFDSVIGVDTQSGAYSVSADASGNVFVSGFLATFPQGVRSGAAFLYTFDADGNPLRSGQFDVTPRLAYATGLSRDASGNLFLVLNDQDAGAHVLCIGPCL